MPDIFLTIPASDIYCDFNQPHTVPSIYVVASNRTGKFLLDGDDLNKQILKYAEKSGSFDFLSNPEEDIYNWGDGERLC